MTADQDPWFVAFFQQEKPATEHRRRLEPVPRFAFFCPDCEWKVATFAGNLTADEVRLPSNSPRDVLAAVQPGRGEAA